MKVAGIVLAGGLSRRMRGREKSLMELAGKPLIQHVCDRLKPQVQYMAINANGTPDRFTFMKLPVVSDPIEGFAGPLAGVLAGLQWASSLDDDVSHVVSVAADTPYFPHDLITRFVAALENSPSETIALASTKGRSHPVFGLWPVNLKSSLEAFLIAGETRKVLAFVDQHGLADVPFDNNALPHDPFFNINTEEDLQAAEAIFAGASA